MLFARTASAAGVDLLTTLLAPLFRIHAMLQALLSAGISSLTAGSLLKAKQKSTATRLVRVP